MLDLIEMVVLASIDENKSRVRSYAYNFYRFGIKGAVLFKLLELKKVSLENKRIEILDSSLTENEVLDMTLKYLSNARRPIKTASWFYSHTAINRDITNKAVDNLEDKGILVKEQRKFLGLIPLKRYNITNTEEKKKIVEGARKVLVEGSENATGDYMKLVSLAAACGCLKLFAGKNEIKQIKNKINRMKKGEYFEISDDNFKEILKGIKSAIAAQTAAASSAGV